MSKIKLLEVPGEGFLFVLERPLEGSDSDVVILPQDQIEELADPDKTPNFELITGELALEFRKHLLQEQIAFYEDRENLDSQIRRSVEFSEESRSREEIETEWKESLEKLRLMLNELKKSPDEVMAPVPGFFSMGEDWRGHRSALKGLQRGI